MNKEEIKQWLYDMHIDHYTINDDFSIDVHGYVCFPFNTKFEQLPYKFGRVTGYFMCQSRGLTTLKNCPDYVGNGFWCHDNYLTSLEFMPSVIHGEFHCGCTSLLVNKYNHQSWLNAIAIHPEAFYRAVFPSPEMEAVHKMLWCL